MKKISQTQDSQRNPIYYLTFSLILNTKQHFHVVRNTFSDLFTLKNLTSNEAEVHQLRRS